MSSSPTSTGVSSPSTPGHVMAPPPPPPPPVPNQVPAIKINTSVAPAPKKSIPNNSNPYEPPAAIQNVMMTKDKKPFTYTPGMGGKLDISQIKSPRMARRVAKNANDEGIEGPPKSSLESNKNTSTPSDGNVFIQPQVAIPVFPMNAAPQVILNKTTPREPNNQVSSPGSGRNQETVPNVPKVEVKNPTSPAIHTFPLAKPESPPIVQLTKAPTPWMQNRNRSQEEQPEWTKRSNSIKNSPPDTPTSPACIQVKPVQGQPTQRRESSPLSSPASILVRPVQIQQAESSPISAPASIQVRPVQQSAGPATIQVRPTQQQQQQQQQSQNRTRQQIPQTPPTPQYREQPQEYQPQYYQQRLQYENDEPRRVQQQSQYLPNPELRKVSQPQERVIPIRIEDRPSVFAAKPEPGHHQFKQNPSAHQQRWTSPPQVQAPPQSHPQPSSATRIIPIMVEDNDQRNTQPRGPVSVQSYDPTTMTPVQSRSFRVLQKITDTVTDSLNDNDGPQMRMQQLAEDDKNLLNKFKEQVDGDGTYLHQEEDPRYRGAAIPSRAFRFLQNMMDSTDSTTSTMPNAVRQNRNSKSFGPDTTEY